MNEKELKKLLKQIISVDKTPNYVYYSENVDENIYLNAEEVAPGTGRRWSTPREICNAWLKEIKDGTLNTALKCLMDEKYQKEQEGMIGNDRNNMRQIFL